MAVNDWSEENCIHLIRAYRERPVLWDPKDPFFAKKTVKMEAWQEIGDILNVPADACKNKMVVLLSSFRREKAKIIHSLKNSKCSDDVYKSTWFGFKEMSFLIDKETERKRQLTGVEDDEEEDGPPSLKKTILKYHFQAPISSNKSIRISSSTSIGENNIKNIPRRINEDSIQTQIMAMPQSTPVLTPAPTPVPSVNTSAVLTENEEEIRSFTNFIANKMKKYTETTKNAVQQAICEIIFRADQNFYETVCYDNYASINNYQNSRRVSEGHDPLDKSLRIQLNDDSIKIDESEESD